MIIAIILVAIYIIFIHASSADAVTQTLSSDIDSIDESAYPGVKQLIKNLQKTYPKWTFKILYTDLNWSDVIANEYTGHESSPKNLVNGSSSSYSGNWICSICGSSKTYDNGSWNCASESAIKYMMDPRNSLNATDIFQFMELSYNECSTDNIKSMVSGTFLNNDTYINAIISAGKTYNVNPYYLVARILQEQGKNGSTSISGTYSGYEGYYNIFNFNASGNTKTEIIVNELAYAKKQGWTSIEASIKGGTAKIASGYIEKGQNTLYFQKFDVENSDGNLYWHQYMQNIMAAQNEGETIRKQFNSIGALSESYTFIIPVYKNMPASACARPATASTTTSSTTTTTITTDLVKVNVNNMLYLRNSPNGTKTSYYLTAGEIVTRIEKATTKVNGTYWDKVMKSNGVTGYAARETYESESTYKLYLVPVNDTSSSSSTTTSSSTATTTTTTTTATNAISDASTTNVKVENSSNRITVIPGITLTKLKSELKNENIVAKDASGNTKGSSDLLGTGTVINDKYVIVMMGDTNGDGKINSGDLFSVQKYLINSNTTVSDSIKKAMDVNKDGKVNSGDLFNMQKYLLGNTTFKAN
jgi:beta-N-acetylglucosaminidase